MSGDASSWTGQLIPDRNAPPYENYDVNNLAAYFQIAPSTWSSYDYYLQASETLPNARIQFNLPAGSHMILGALTVTPVTAQAPLAALPTGWTSSPISRQYFGMTWGACCQPLAGRAIRHDTFLGF